MISTSRAVTKDFVKKTGDAITGELVLENNIAIQGKSQLGVVRDIFKFNSFGNMTYGSFFGNFAITALNDRPFLIENNTFINRNIWHSGSIEKATSTDIEVTDSTKGFVLRSPNGTRYRLTVNDAGVVLIESL